MRITIINQFYTPDISPTAHLSASLAEHLAKKGHDVTVVTSWGGYSEDARAQKGATERENGVRVKRIWTPKLGKSSHIRRIIDYACFYAGTYISMLLLKRQDVVISLTTPPLIAWAAIIHKWFKRKTKIILWNMDCYPELPERAGVFKMEGFVSKVLQFLNRGLFKRLDHLVCLDTAMVDLLMGRYKPKKRELPISIIPNWEDADFFPADVKHEPWEGIDRLGLTGKFTVVYLGNMGYGHDFATMLDAAEILKDNDDIRFLFIGGGKRKDPTAQEAERRGLTNVIVHSYVDKSETPNVMAGATCALITLRDDMLGVMSPSKMHANLAMRLPVLYVGPEGCNVDDAIKRFGCGSSIRIGDVEGLVNQIRTLAENKDKLEAARESARRAFDESYNDQSAHARFDEVLEQVAGA